MRKSTNATAVSADRPSRKTPSSRKVEAPVVQPSSLPWIDRPSNFEKNAFVDEEEDFSRTPGVMMLIDNSNLWIEGKKYAARKRAMQVSEIPQWRYNLGKLLKVILNGREPALIRLFGSIPPPQDDLWKSFSARVQVDLTPRSSWTGGERCVDHKFVQLAAEDYTSVSCQTRVERSYCFVTGDGDYYFLVSSILRKGFAVEMWSWRDALNAQYATLQRRHPELLTIHFLEDRMQDFEFLETSFRVDRQLVPPDRTLVFLPGCERQAKIFHDTASVPFYYYKLPDGCVALICSFVVPNLDALFEQARSIDSETRVVSFLDWRQSNKESLQVQLHLLQDSNPFRALLSDPRRPIHPAAPKPFLSAKARGVSSEEQAKTSSVKPSSVQQPAADPIGGPPLSENSTDDGFSVVENRKKQVRSLKVKHKQATFGLKRCYAREFCPAGLSCTFGHSIQEKTLFENIPGGRTPYHCFKTRRCPQGDACRFILHPSFCPFAHPPKELYFCLSCGSPQPHETKNCSYSHNDRPPISHASVQILKSQKYLQ